jgi:hypothetical protein
MMGVIKVKLRIKKKKKKEKARDGREVETVGGKSS